MNANPKLLELLVEWDEQRRLGRDLTAEQLCPDDLSLQTELRQRIDKRQRLQPLVALPEETQVEMPRTSSPIAALPGFEILEVLGRGGMGVVYKARQKALNRLTAVKMILAGANAGRQEMQRFRTEAEAVARLRHPGIVQIYDVGEHAGSPYLVLELIEGGSLAQHLGGKPLPARRAAEIAYALALAVAHAHQHGIVHRDLKPANVLLAVDSGQWTVDGEKRASPRHATTVAPSSLSTVHRPPFTTKIADFGLAKRLDEDLGQTQTGAVMGSPSYMAPEQAEGRTRDIGPSVDIYALGAILYEMLTGRPPFLGDSIVETLEQVRYNDPVPPRRLQPKVTADLEAICLKCLEKRPAHRYASAVELAADLERFLAGEPIHARSATMADQLLRALRHMSFDPKFHRLKYAFLWLAPVPFTANLVGFLTLQNLDDYHQLMVGFSLMAVLGVLALTIGGNWRVIAQVQPRQRRHIKAVMLAHVVSTIGATLILWCYMPGRPPADLFLVYPLWMVIAADTFLSLASESGVFYLVATTCYCGVVAALLFPALSPLFVGTLMSANMTAQGVFLWQIGKRERWN